MNWKGHLLFWTVHWAMPLLAGLVLLLGWRGGSCPAWARGLWRHRWPFFLLSRVLFALLLYPVLGYGGSRDFEEWWVPEARALLDGTAPVNPSQHNPLFVPLLAAGLRLFPAGGGAGVLLPFLLGEALLVRSASRIARRLHGEGAEEWLGTWLLLSPALWYQSVVRAQDETLFLGLLLFSLSLLLEGRRRLGAAVLGLGFCATKLTYGPYAAAALLFTATDARGLLLSGLSFLAPCALAWGPRLLAGDPLLPPAVLERQAWMSGSGLGIPDLLARLGAEVPPRWSALLCAAATGALLLHLRFRRTGPPSPRRLLTSLVLVHCLQMLLLPVCLPPYHAQGSALILLWLWPFRGDRGWRHLLAAVLLLDVGVSLWWNALETEAVLNGVSIPVHGALLFLGFRTAGDPVREGSPRGSGR